VAGRGGLLKALAKTENNIRRPCHMSGAQKISSLLVLKYSLYREYFNQTYGYHLHP
jgi:hypothetical protein